MLDPLSLPVFIGIFGGVILLKYLINRCDKNERQNRILIQNQNQNQNQNQETQELIHQDIPPKYEELPPQYNE